MTSRLRLGGVAALAATASALAFSSTASAIDDIDSTEIRKDVTVAGILAHERAFQRIANNNGGTRASGTPGYDASAAYVKKRLQSAGYTVKEQPFSFAYFEELATPEFEQIAPNAKTYVHETDFLTADYSGSGDVTADVTPVDVVLPPGPDPSTSNSGCEPEDFNGFTAGDIALVQRGTCDFAVKATNAQDAGAAAVIIFNEGQPGRTDVVGATLGGPNYTIPVIGISFALGNELAQASNPRVRVATATTSETRLTKNLTAENTKRGDAGRTIVVGAHLDSVAAGPGINDNGSGTAGILEIAEEMAERNRGARNRIRFAFWGAEESGLIGSQYYVDSLSDEQLGTIYANLNFDMIGSPNYARFVYDGDGSDSDAGGPPGSAQIEEMFNDHFDSEGLATEPTAFDGRSDYGPFIDAGVPAGGLFTGAEGVKTPEQAAKFGGTAGLAFDPCYHQACDDITNLSTKALFEMGDAAAHAVRVLSRTKTGFFEDGSRARGKARAKARGKASKFDYRGSHLAR